MAEVTTGRRPVALVVGATRGIGAALAEGFAQTHDLVLTGRDAAALATVAEACRAAGAQVTSHPLDVLDAEQVAEVIRAAWSETGGIDVALVSAGIIEPHERPLWELSLEESWQVLEVNLRGPLAVAHTLAPLMLAAGGGRIVHVNSGSAVRNADTYAAYGASKAGLARITGSLHEAGSERGLRVFDLAPGVVRTDMTASMPMHEARTDWTEPREVVELARALASGELDRWSGRMVRAGTDTPASLAAVGTDLDDRARTLALRPYGADDPLA